MMFVFFFFKPKVDSEWNNWGEFGSCSQTCGNGVQSRYRNCTNQKYSDCYGINEDFQQECETSPICPGRIHLSLIKYYNCSTLFSAQMIPIDA